MKNHNSIIALMLATLIFWGCGNNSQKFEVTDNSEIAWNSDVRFLKASVNNRSDIDTWGHLYRDVDQISFYVKKNIKLHKKYKFIRGAKFSTFIKDKPFNFILELWAGYLGNRKSPSPFYISCLNDYDGIASFEAHDVNLDDIKSITFFFPSYENLKNKMLNDTKESGIKRGIDSLYSILRLIEEEIH